MRSLRAVSAFIISAVLLSGCGNSVSTGAPSEEPVFSDGAGADTPSEEADAAFGTVDTAEKQPVNTDEVFSEAAVPEEETEAIPDEELSGYALTARKVLLDIMNEPDVWAIVGIDLLDMTGDGVPELLVNISQDNGRRGFLDIYDIAGGERLLTVIDQEYDLTVCYDGDNNAHYIIRGDHWTTTAGGMNGQVISYYDLWFSGGINVSLPLMIVPEELPDDTGEHHLTHRVYKDAEFNYNCQNSECTHHDYNDYGFTVGKPIYEFYIVDFFTGALNDVQADVAQLIGETVFSGLTQSESRTGTWLYCADVSGFEEFWRSAHELIAAEGY